MGMTILTNRDWHTPLDTEKARGCDAAPGSGDRINEARQLSTQQKKMPTIRCAAIALVGLLIFAVGMAMLTGGLLLPVALATALTVGTAVTATGTLLTVAAATKYISSKDEVVDNSKAKDPIEDPFEDNDKELNLLPKDKANDLRTAISIIKGE